MGAGGWGLRGWGLGWVRMIGREDRDDVWDDWDMLGIMRVGLDSWDDYGDGWLGK